MLILVTFIPVTVIKEEAIETIDTTRADKNGKDTKNDKYLGIFARVPWICYSITFWKKSVPISALFDFSS